MELQIAASPALPEEPPPTDDELAQALLEETRRIAEHVLPGVPLS